MINLTQHKATPAQIKSGVVDLNDEAREKLSQYLTFETLTDIKEIRSRASLIAELAKENSEYYQHDVMIGGAPYLMSSLEYELDKAGFVSFYAFSQRKSIEKIKEDGTVEKTAVFEHSGFIRM